jgi:hypothetical protein
MVRNTLLKWAAAAALACAVPAIGLARHTPTVAATSATTSSHVSSKPVSMSATTSLSPKHGARQRSTKHSKHRHLTSRHHKASKLSATRHKAATR